MISPSSTSTTTSSIRKTSNTSTDPPQDHAFIGLNAFAFGIVVGYLTWSSKIVALRLLSDVLSQLLGHWFLLASMWIYLLVLLSRVCCSGGSCKEEDALVTLARRRFCVGALVGMLLGWVVLDPVLLKVSLADQYPCIGLYCLFIGLIAWLSGRCHGSLDCTKDDEEDKCTLPKAEIV